MDTIEALKTRRSIRKYKSDPVPKELIEKVIDCGRLAPTARNVQPWEFVVITDSSTLKRIGGMANHGKFIADAPVCVVVLSKETKYWLEDASAATQNLLLAAHALGLGACWIAGDKKDYAEPVRELVGAPAGFRLISLVTIGYADEQPTADKKRSLGEVLHWERF